MPKSFEQWLDHIQTVHIRSIELGLDRVNTVWRRLKLEHQPVTIAVAGTNGKGSSVALLGAIYRQAGYRVGQYTSPHLIRYNERIAINLRPVEDKYIIEAFTAIEEARQDIALTYFEFSTLAALLVFQRQNVDVQLLEVGMGGRLDAVNIIRNDVALITSISLDHVDWLGNTREKIGTEKAGIIKPFGLAICSDPKPPASIFTTAKSVQATLFQLGVDFDFLEKGQHWCWHTKSTNNPNNQLRDLHQTLKGKHQLQNSAGVLQAIYILQNKLAVTAQHIRTACIQSTITGRQQLFKGPPRVLLDVSHNADAVKALSLKLKKIDNQSKNRIIAVFGALSGKALTAMFDEIGCQINHWFLVNIEGERGRSAQSLADELSEIMTAKEVKPQAVKNKMTLCDSPLSGYQQAIKLAEKDDLVLIFGSFRTVGAIISSLES